MHRNYIQYHTAAVIEQLAVTVRISRRSAPKGLLIPHLSSITYNNNTRLTGHKRAEEDEGRDDPMVRCLQTREPAVVAAQARCLTVPRGGGGGVVVVFVVQVRTLAATKTPRHQHTHTPVRCGTTTVARTTTNRATGTTTLTLSLSSEVLSTVCMFIMWCVLRQTPTRRNWLLSVRRRVQKCVCPCVTGRYRTKVTTTKKGRGPRTKRQKIFFVLPNNDIKQKSPKSEYRHHHRSK